MKNAMNMSFKLLVPVLVPVLTPLLAGSLGLAGLMSAAHAESPGEQDAKYGKAPTAMCVGCHGIDGYKASFPTVYLVPKISGQSQKYIENALQAYRKGDRNHPSMKAVAGSLTDAEITALAVYYSKNLGASASK
jgi:cytochrome c553